MTLAKTIWLSGFERAFSRTPTDPWENQAESAKAPHINTARKIIEAGFVTGTPAQPAFDRATLTKLVLETQQCGVGDRDEAGTFRKIFCDDESLSAYDKHGECDCRKTVDAILAAQPLAAPVETDAISDWVSSRLADAVARSSAGSAGAALRIARAYLVEEAESGSVWSSLGNAKAVAAIDAALTATEPQTLGVWQPIETAPRDETSILATDIRVMECFACVFWYHTNEKFPWQTEDGIGYHKDRFTHWMPIPSTSSLTRPQLGLALLLPPAQLPLNGFPNEIRSLFIRVRVQNPVDTVQRPAWKAGWCLLFVDLSASHAEYNS
jgi:hypothetical protein